MAIGQPKTTQGQIGDSKETIVIAVPSLENPTKHNYRSYKFKYK